MNVIGLIVTELHTFEVSLSIDLYRLTYIIHFLIIVKVSTSPIFTIKSYKSLYLKNGPIKTYKIVYFPPFSIVNLYFCRSNEENSYNMHSSVISRKAINEDLFIFLTLFSIVFH